MAVPYKHPRGTRAALTTLATASGLVVGQVYMLTDESRLALATAVNAFVTLPKQGEAAPNASYRTILDSSGSHTAARVAGTYFLGQGDPAGITGTGTLYPPNMIYLDAADFPTVDGLAPKLRLRAVLAVNDVAPTGNFTFGLYPVTTPAVSGAAGVRIWTLGTVVTGSTALATAPAADAGLSLVSTDFAVPAAGLYVLGFVSTAAVAASSHLHLSANLQMRNA